MSGSDVYIGGRQSVDGVQEDLLLLKYNNLGRNNGQKPMLEMVMVEMK